MEKIGIKKGPSHGKSANGPLFIFFLGAWSICILNRGRSTPKKRTPSSIYGLIAVSGSIPLFRSI